MTSQEWSNLHPSSQPSPASPQPQMAPLDYLQKHNIMKMFSEFMKMFSEFHIKRDSSYLTSINGPLGHLQPLLNTSRGCEHRHGSGHCVVPPTASTTSVGSGHCAHVVLYSDEYRHLEATGHIQLSNIDPPMQRGVPISTRTSTSISRLHTRSASRSYLRYFLANDKIPDNLKETFLQRQLYLVYVLVKTDEPPTRRVLRPYSRESSQHQ